MDPQLLRTQILTQKPSPNDQQEEAIFANELEFLLRAAPGSGKTWTSCRRFIWRAISWPYPAGGIALLSFTNVAVHEFQDAAATLGQSHLLSDPNYLGTFDAFLERFVIAPFGHLLNGATTRPRLFQAPRPGDRNNSALQCWATIGGKKQPVYAWEIFPALENDKVVFHASRDRGGGILDTTKADAAITGLLKQGRYTHSHRAYWAYRLLSARAHIAKRLSLRFPEIIVDEAQDSNVWLLALLDILRSYGSRITLVGDPDQCIYEFAMADATSLSAFQTKWQIPEKPLDLSFRCNDRIACAIKCIGTNAAFRARDPGTEHKRAFVFSETEKDFRNSVAAFRELLQSAGIPESRSAIICRGNDHLRSLRGQVNYEELTGTTKRLAEAAFHRDCRKDYHEAFSRVDKVLRELIWDDCTWETLDESSDSASAVAYRLNVWRFVKSDQGLPSVSLAGDVWVSSMRERMAALIAQLGADPVQTLGKKIQRKGLSKDQLQLPLFEEQALFPSIRQETIHKVKGESIDAVLVLGSKKFWDSVVASIINGQNTEDRRLAYVAMSRARDLLVLSLPSHHSKKHGECWKNWGFANLQAE